MIATRTVVARQIISIHKYRGFSEMVEISEEK